MLAAVIRNFNLLAVEEVPTPEPRGDEVLVEVRAASINPSDVKNVAGVMHGTTLPRIPGRDFAGVVRRGPAELVGMEVWGTGGDIGFTRDGSHAQYIVLPRTGMTPRPALMSVDAAGSAGVTFVTAWQAMVTSAHVSPEDTALIVGAAGGVGSAAVQIAKLRGARVIGAVRSQKDFPAARDAGADEVLSSTDPDFAARVRQAANDRGASVVFDTSGMMFAASVEAAAMSARIPIIAAPGDGIATFNLRAVYRKQLHVIGVDTLQLNATNCAKLLETMTPAFQSGQLRAKSGVALPLSQAVAGYEESSHGGSRIVLHPFG